MNTVYIIVASVLIGLLSGYLFGIYHGAKMGIRIFGKDAITLAFRTIDANPDQFAYLKDEPLSFPDHEEWIQQAINRKARRDTVMDEWQREKARLHGDGIF